MSDDLSNKNVLCFNCDWRGPFGQLKREEILICPTCHSDNTRIIKSLDDKMYFTKRLCRGDDIDFGLKCCPFCGRDSANLELYSYTDTDTSSVVFVVSCLCCHSKSASAHDRDHAISEWNRRADGPELANQKAQNEALMVTITSMGQTTNDLLDKCKEFEAQNAVLRKALDRIQEMVDVKECDDCEIVFSNIYQEAEQALSTTPSEALEKQRKKDEVLDMLVKVLEKTDDAMAIHSDRHNEPFVQSFCRGGKSIVRKALAAAKKLEGE